ncbi:kinase-like domain-containing protein, partial [Mycena pura]
PEVQYEGWVAQVIAPLREFIIQGANPRNHFLDLQEIADGPGDATLYSARVAESEVMIGRRPSRVAIKIVPIHPAGDSDSTIGDILQELRVLRHVSECEHVLRMDALYIDPVDDALWIRMELMTRTLASVIDSLNTAGLKLTEHIIAGYMKDILTALAHLRAHDVSPRDISASNMLINSDGVLKLSESLPE